MSEQDLEWLEARDFITVDRSHRGEWVATTHDPNASTLQTRQAIAPTFVEAIANLRAQVEA